MTESYPQVCVDCGRPIDITIKCESCGKVLCPFDVRVLDEYETLCQECYEGLTFQYRARSCDVGRPGKR